MSFVSWCDVAAQVEFWLTRWMFPPHSALRTVTLFSEVPNTSLRERPCRFPSVATSHMQWNQQVLRRRQHLSLDWRFPVDAVWCRNGLSTARQLFPTAHHYSLAVQYTFTEFRSKASDLVGSDGFWLGITAVPANQFHWIDGSSFAGI